MGKPLADYVKLPQLDEYKEWFKDFADLYREDGILQVTWKTLDGPMHHSGMSHRAISQLVRILSMDWKNEIIIFTHIGDSWMTESDPNGWETYSELPTQRFQHQYFDDTNLIGVLPGPGFHWDSAMLSDITICSDDTWIEVPHAHGGLVPGDGMGLMAQHFFGTKRGNYYMMTARQWTAQQMLDWGMVSEVVPKDQVMARAWEIARMLKTMPYENRTIMSNLAKRPLKKLLVEDLKLHTVRRPAGREVHQPDQRLALLPRLDAAAPHPGELGRLPHQAHRVVQGGRGRPRGQPLRPQAAREALPPRARRRQQQVSFSTHGRVLRRKIPWESLWLITSSCPSLTSIKSGSRTSPT